MTDQEIIKAIAELDGWKYVELFKYSMGKDPPSIPFMGWAHKDKKFMPLYLDSRDAIIPVIEKQSFGDKINIVDILTPENNDWTVEVAVTVMTTTPRQLCEALLRTTGKWIE